jgi:hypothetical protein
MLIQDLALGLLPWGLLLGSLLRLGLSIIALWLLGRDISVVSLGYLRGLFLDLFSLPHRLLGECALPLLLLALVLCLVVRHSEILFIYGRVRRKCINI